MSVFVNKINLTKMLLEDKQYISLSVTNDKAESIELNNEDAISIEIFDGATPILCKAVSKESGFGHTKITFRILSNDEIKILEARSK